MSTAINNQLNTLATEFMKQEQLLDHVTKLHVIATATAVAKPKKIISFHSGKSITKPKASTHRVKHVATQKHAKLMKYQGIRVNHKNRFVDA